MTVVHGVDVSSYQPDWRPGSNDSFVFVKATEGSSYRNPKHAVQVDRARQARLVVGHYHYLHAGQPEQQAAFFAGTPGIQDHDILCVDWESRSPDIPASDKDRFVRTVQKFWPKCRMVVYTYTFYPPYVANPGDLADGLWIADYRSAAPKMPWMFHQFTDKPIDQNVAKFDSVAALRDWASFASGQPVSPSSGQPVSPSSKPPDGPAPSPNSTIPEGTPFMAAGTPIVANVSIPQTLPPNQDGYVTINDKGHVSVVTGESPGIDVLAALTVSGLKAGEYVDFWWTKEAKQAGKPDQQNGNDGHVTVGYVEGAPHTAVQIGFKHLLAPEKAPWVNCLRLRFHTNSYTASITYKQFRGWRL